MFTRKRLKLHKLHSQSGFTIMESLLAIMVVAILMTSIAPVLVLSVATRMQAKRVEWGAQAASSYLDGIKSGAIKPPDHIVELNQATPDFSFDPSQQAEFAKTPAPASTLPACDNLTAAAGYCEDSAAQSLYCVDLDTDGCSTGSNQDLIIQAFRSVLKPPTGTLEPLNSAEQTKKGYLLGIRVYRANAFDGNRTLIAGETESSFTGGTGLKKEQAPLVEMSTEIAGVGTTRNDFCDRLGGCGRETNP